MFLYLTRTFCINTCYITLHTNHILLIYRYMNYCCTVIILVFYTVYFKMYLSSLRTLHL